MRLALGQMNATIGDFAGNGARIEALWKEAEAAKADLLLVPELALCGYPPRDLLDRPSFQADAAAPPRGADPPLREDRPSSRGRFLPNPSKTGKPLFNAAVLLRNGRVAAVARKCLLPAYDVFDEVRHFEPAEEPGARPPRRAAGRPHDLRGPLERQGLLPGRGASIATTRERRSSGAGPT